MHTLAQYIMPSYSLLLALTLFDFGLPIKSFFAYFSWIVYKRSHSHIFFSVRANHACHSVVTVHYDKFLYWGTLVLESSALWTHKVGLDCRHSTFKAPSFGVQMQGFDLNNSLSLLHEERGQMPLWSSSSCSTAVPFGPLLTLVYKTKAEDFLPMLTLYAKTVRLSTCTPTAAKAAAFNLPWSPRSSRLLFLFFFYALSTAVDPLTLVAHSLLTHCFSHTPDVLNKRRRERRRKSLSWGSRPFIRARCFVCNIHSHFTGIRLNRLNTVEEHCTVIREHSA